MGARNPDKPEGEKGQRGRRAVRRDATCKVRIGKVVRRGVVALTGDELRFNTGRTGRDGQDFFVHVRLDAITKLTADGPAGTLTVATADQEPVTFHLGRLAAAWKDIIDERPNLLRYLEIEPGSRVGVVGVDDEALARALEARGVPLEAGGGLDFLFAGAQHRADLARMPALAARVRPGGGIVWMVYPEESRVITEAQVVEAARAAGLASGVAVDLSPGVVALRLLRHAG